MRTTCTSCNKEKTTKELGAYKEFGTLVVPDTCLTCSSMIEKLRNLINDKDRGKMTKLVFFKLRGELFSTVGRSLPIFEEVY